MNVVLPFAFYTVSIVLIVLVIFLLIFIFSYVMSLLDVIGRPLNNLSIASSKCESSNDENSNCKLIRLAYFFIQGYLNTILDYYNIALELSRFLGLVIILAFVVLALSIYVTAKQTVWKFDILDKVIIGFFFVLFAGLVAFVPIIFSKVKNYTDQISKLCPSEITQDTEIYCFLMNYIPSISDSMFISSIVLVSASFLIYSVTFFTILFVKMKNQTKVTSESEKSKNRD
jgi:hypothetical protein